MASKIKCRRQQRCGKRDQVQEAAKVWQARSSAGGSKGVASVIKCRRQQRCGKRDQVQEAAKVWQA